MGQQQLLLIVLGVIIVGIAIVVGINLFNAQAEESTKDALISTATNLGAMAQQYYKKPAAMGGGNQSFDGTGDPAGNAVAFEDFVTTTVSNLEANDPNMDAGSIEITSTADECAIAITPAVALDYDWVVTTTVTATTMGSIVE